MPTLIWSIRLSTVCCPKILPHYRPNHPDERINYDGNFLIPTISKLTTTLYNTAAIFGRGNSIFSPKLPKNDDDVLAEAALVSARRLAVNSKERAHAWYALSRRRQKLKIRLRELMTDHAIKTHRRSPILQEEKLVNVSCFINEKNEVLATDDEKHDAIFDISTMRSVILILC